MTTTEIENKLNQIYLDNRLNLIKAIIAKRKAKRTRKAIPTDKLETITHENGVVLPFQYDDDEENIENNQISPLMARIFGQ